MQFDFPKTYGDHIIKAGLAEKFPDGVAFFNELIKGYGADAALSFIKKVRPLLTYKIPFEPKHLASEENVIFSVLEKKYYSDAWQGLYKFLDCKAWGYIALGFAMESKLDFATAVLEDLGYQDAAHIVHMLSKYISPAALALCSYSIFFETYEKIIEYKILDQIELISAKLLKVVPSELLDAIHIATTPSGDPRHAESVYRPPVSAEVS